MDIEDSQIFYVSSEDRIDGNSSNFSYNFKITNDKEYDHCAILAASIPKSYYLIDENNDQFNLVENGVNVALTIPHGNYTLTAWKSMLQTLLTSNSPNGWTYTTSFPSTNTTNTGKMTFTVSGNGGIQPQFIFSEHVFDQMGFNPGTYTFAGNSLTSENVINLQLVNAIFIHSDIVNNKDDNILQDVYSNTSDYSNITYQATELLSYAKKLSNKTSWTARFYLTDVESNPINLNGLNWNFTIIFFKKNNIFDMIRNFIKLSIIDK